MKLLKYISFILLTATFAPSLCNAEANLVSKDWIVMCEEDVFNEKTPFKCHMLSKSKTSGFILLIERDKSNDLSMLLLEEGEELPDSLTTKLQTKSLVKIDKQPSISGSGKISRRNDNYNQITLEEDQDIISDLIGRMKKGSTLNLKIEVAGIPFLGRFSLSGFTKAVNHFLLTDKRRSAVASTGKAGSSKLLGLGLPVKEWEKAHSKVKKDVMGWLYDNDWVVGFTEKNVTLLHRLWERPGITPKEVRSEFKKYIPSDSVFIKKYSPDGRPNTTVKVYTSEKLRKEIDDESKWGEEKPGTFTVFYSADENRILRAFIATGNNP